MWEEHHWWRRFGEHRESGWSSSCFAKDKDHVDGQGVSKWSRRGIGEEITIQDHDDKRAAGNGQRAWDDQQRGKAQSFLWQTDTLGYVLQLHDTI